MPAQQGTSTILKKLQGLDTAVRKHANDPTELGRIDVPPGIKNGVAQVVKVYFGEVQAGKQNAGELFFRAEAVIMEPEFIKVDGRQVKCRGLRTSIMEMLCDTATKANPPVATPKAEHVANVLNEMRKMGANTAGATGASLASLAAAIEQTKPYINFSTSPRYDQADKDKPVDQRKVTGAWENWNGHEGLADYTPPEAGSRSSFQDGDAAAPSANGDGHGSDPTPDELDPPPSGSAGDAGAGDEAPDLDALAAKADAQDEASIIELTNIAEAAGIDVEDGSDWAKSSTYADAIGMIQAAWAGGDEGTPEPEPDPEPKKGDVFHCKVPVTDPKTKKTTMKKVECKVMVVYKKNQTVDLQNLTNPRLVYKGKKWDELEK